MELRRGLGLPAVALWTGQEREREREPCLLAGGFTVLLFLLLLMPPPALPFPLPSPLSSLLPTHSEKTFIHSFFSDGGPRSVGRAGGSERRPDRTEADDRKKYR